jgi:hypothetical protein
VLVAVGDVVPHGDRDRIPVEIRKIGSGRAFVQVTHDQGWDVAGAELREALRTGKPFAAVEVRPVFRADLEVAQAVSA